MQTTVIGSPPDRAFGVDASPCSDRSLGNQREAAIDRIHEVLGWQPEMPLPEGLATVVDHLKASVHCRNVATRVDRGRHDRERR
jgi:nucleoside-diphosphate-sugar epimerase